MTAPLVSVCIPAHNQIGYVLKCVECLRGQPRLGEILIVDDGSEADQGEAMKKIPGVAVSWYPASGFVKSCNRLVKKAQYPYVLLLNSDAFAHANAIKYMAENLDQNYAVCGARLLFARGSRYGVEGNVQHAGVGFNKFGVPYHPFMSMPGDEPCVTVWRSVNAVTGAAMMVKKDVWARIGGFDNKFQPAVYEDVDYCLAVKKLGYEIAYEPKAIFEHVMHGSQTDTTGWFAPANHDKNLSLLFTKHGQPKTDDEIYFRMR